MSTLSREHRRLLENTVAQARAIAEEGAGKVLADQYAVHHHEPWPHMKDVPGDSSTVLREKDSYASCATSFALMVASLETGAIRSAKRKKSSISSSVRL